MNNDQNAETADKSTLRMELFIILILGIFVYLFSARYEVFEQIVDFTRKHENWQADELMIVSVYLVIALAFFSLRRWREALESHDRLQLKNKELQAAIDEIKQLRGIIPICSSCKKIRDDDGYWHQVESYIRDHSEAEFTHGICPDCVTKYYSDYVQG